MSFIIGCVVIALIVGAFILCLNDYSFLSIPLLLISFFGIYACTTNPKLIAEREKEALIQEEEDKKCQAPYLVSEVGDLQLWAYRPRCNSSSQDIVYFSKSGVKYTECHTVGKRNVCNAKQVPNNK